MSGATAQPSSGRPAEPDFMVGDCLVQPAMGRITRGERVFRLEPKVLEVLLCLAKYPGELLTKDDIIRVVWADTFVTEHVLTHAIWQLRRALGGSGDSRQYIETFPKRGYRLVAPVHLAPVRIRSLAVLPLANLARDPEQDYFVDGMTDALINELARISALQVISRTSVMRYKDSCPPLPQVAAELHVDGVVEGSVLRERNRVRISVQLIHAATDHHLWAKTYECGVRGVLTLQASLARAIAAEIRVKLTPQERSRLAMPRPVNPAAHEAYLKGYYCWNRASEDSVQQSLAYFEEALAIDPDYAAAYTGLADVYCTITSPILGSIAPADGVAKIRPAVSRALKLNKSLPEAHQARGWLKHYYEWDWAGAEAAYARALELNPGFAMAHAGRGILFGCLERHEEAVASLRRACELDPLSLMFNTLYGFTLLLAGRPAEALDQVKKTLPLEPNFWFAYEVSAMALSATREYDQAIATAKAAVRLLGEGGTYPRGILGHIYGLAGRASDARRILDELDALSRLRYVSPALRAYVYHGLGERDPAFAQLQEGYRLRDTAMIWMKVMWKTWSDDERYQDLVRRMNFPR